MRKRMAKCLVKTLILTVLACMTVTVNAFAVTVSKPVINLSSPARGAVLVKSSNVEKKSGYQIKYGKISSLKNAKVITVANTGNLSKRINNLTAGKKYYVRVRAYKTVNGGKKFGSWSAVKSCTTRTNTVAYVKAWKINLETSKKSTQKWNSNPKEYTAPYMAKVYVYAGVGPYSKSQWIKLKYNGNIRYTYVNVNKEKNIFTTSKSNFTYQNYEKYCKTDLQRDIVKRAMDVYTNLPSNPISYDNNHVTYHVGDGLRSSLDCSNFTRYIINEVLGVNAVNPKPPYIWYDAKNGSSIGDTDEYEIYLDKISYNNLQPGDIVCFDDDLNKGESAYDYVDHVGIYLGNNEFIHSTNALAGGVSGVKISPISGKYYKWDGKTRFKGAGRIRLVEKKSSDFDSE